VRNSRQIQRDGFPDPGEHPAERTREAYEDHYWRKLIFEAMYGNNPNPRRALDLPGNFGPLISGKMAPLKRGADEEEPFF
jgi:hypothetical protein